MNITGLEVFIYEEKSLAKIIFLEYFTELTNSVYYFICLCKLYRKGINILYIIPDINCRNQNFCLKHLRFEKILNNNYKLYNSYKCYLLNL